MQQEIKNMTSEELIKLIKCGETSTVQFKQEFTTQRQIAEDMVAFANSGGGRLLFGVKDKTGEIVGMDYSFIQTLSRELGNAANEHVRPTIYIRTEVVEVEGKMILAATVQEGRNKPYKDLSGNIWVKQGADKRRITENSEILSLFQESGQYYPDEAGIPGSSQKDLDTLVLDRFFENVYGKAMTDFDVSRERLLKNLHITDAEGRLTTSGALFFGQHPQQFKPSYVIKAVWYYGNDIGGKEYRDSRDIEGTIPEMYEQAMMWLKATLRRTQNGQSFNSIGKLEIPETVLEELLQNALLHIDLLKPAAIRLLVFDNRVEIINPGCIMGGHTIEEVMLGNSYLRNPLLANFGAKTMPYRGLGSGIPRILREDCRMEISDSKAGNQFTATVWRPDVVENVKNVVENNPDVVEKYIENLVVAEKSTLKSTQKSTQKAIVEIIEINPQVTISQVAEQLKLNMRGIAKHFKNLQAQGIIRRVGPDKGGHWEVVSP